MKIGCRRIPSLTCRKKAQTTEKFQLFSISAWQFLILRFHRAAFQRFQPVFTIRANSRNSRRKFQHVSVSAFKISDLFIGFTRQFSVF
jgi:hypothetical protein